MPGLSICASIACLAAPGARTETPPLQTFSTWTYMLQGARYGREVYAVDLPGLRRAMKGQSNGASAMAALQSGRVWYSRRMTFLIDVSGAKRRELLEALLKTCWPSPDFPSRRADVIAFLDWQGRAFSQRDEVEYLFSPGGSMTIRFNAALVKRFTSRDLTQAMRTMLFSKTVENPGRVEKIAADLETLLR